MRQGADLKKIKTAHASHIESLDVLRERWKVRW